MKKLFTFLALVLGLVSCQTEPEGFGVNAGGEVDTVISIAIPEAETRAGGLNSAVGAFENKVLDGDLTMRYICEVHYGNEMKTLEKQYSDGKTVQFPVRLIPNREYRFVVWADIVNETAKEDIHYNTEDGLENISLHNTWEAMDETRDAYFCSESRTFTGAGDITLTLKRPFAKVRVITTDMVELLGVDPAYAKVVYTTPYYSKFDAKTGVVATENYKKNHEFAIATYGDNTNESKVLFTDYFFATVDQEAVQFVLSVYEDNTWAEDKLIKTTEFNTTIPVRRNYLTTIQGNILTVGDEITVKVEDAFDGNIDFDVEEDTITTTVNTPVEFAAAFADDSNIDVVVLNEDINLDELFSRAAFTAYTLKNGRTLTIDLNRNTLSATTTENSGNQEIFLVKGNLTVKNGTIVYEHKGENMGWGSMTTIFDVTAGGVLNLEGVTAQNLGGSDMGFVAHLNNWGEVTLNVENCILESNYVPVRVFNSGHDMNNVTIKNSTLNGVSAAFWVHNYTVADFGTEAKAEAQKALLNFDIYNGTNTFSPDVNGIRYGFTNAVRTDAYGITKVVSEDGTEVTLGSLVENGVVRRGVAGNDSNDVIKKIVLGDGIAELPNRTFYRYFALETVELPSTLTVLGANGSNSTSGNIFQGCKSLKNIVIPESVTTMGPGVFYGCLALESINIPAGVTRIEEYALRETGLVSVEFPEGVTYFGPMAFRDCKQLKEVIINAPEFTVEANAFGVMAGTLPGTTIYVANAEMKAYLESTLAYKNQFTIVAPEVVNTTDDLKAALAEEGAKMVSLAAGEYTFPSSSVKAGQTIICEEGTVFTGTSGLNINGATVIGAEFKNESGVAVSGTINGTFKNCTFNGEEALRWCYSEAGKTNVFENCVIKTDFRGFHFDGMEGDVIFRNCEINGFNAYGGEGTATFEGCTFGCDQSRYNGLNIYSNTNLINCTFNFVSGKTNFIDMEGTGKTLKITNCVATLDGATVDVATFVGGSKLADNTVIYE